MNTILAGVCARRWRRISVAVFTFLVLGCMARADVVTDWNKNAENAILSSNSLKGNSIGAARVYVLMHAAIFDAVNGIKPHFTPYHVDLTAPKGASTRAAAIQAAYVVLVSLIPSQKSTFDAERAASLASLAGDADDDGSTDGMAIARGLAWGELVANDILTWRSTDGFSRVLPPVTGGLAPGQWRPTPPQFLPMANPQVATMTPYVLDSPSQFRPAGPPALTSDRYAANFNETKMLGRATGSSRTDEQTLIAQYWAGNVSISWNRVCSSLVLERDLPLTVSARLLAVMNLALADSTVAGWDSKLFFIDRNWRPVTAIELADIHTNSNTVADPAWTPLLTTPAHPEYVSAHAVFSAGASGVLADFFGDNTSFSLESVGLPGTARAYSSFSSALDEASLSRIYGGIHFRSALDDGRALGGEVAQYVLSHAALPLHGKEVGKIQHDHPRGGALNIEAAEPEK